ncbi:MAG: fibronectin type III domain-containing protein, partial [Bacteroidales bacterium]|nr:fibronectin type III domain-containing protein [Bacteroidales bacterium]
MKKFLSLIVMAIAFAIQLPAQIVTVGNENSSITDYGPIYSLYNNSFSEVIYLASELTAGTITQISYQYGFSTPLVDPNPTIYMGEVSRSSFSSASDWETSTLTQVYSGGSVTYNQGWVTITLSTPFVYSGANNLLVAYKSQDREWDGDLVFRQTATTDTKMIINYDDYYIVSGTMPTSSGYNEAFTTRPNTRFTIVGGDEDYCYPVSNVTVTNILSEEATISWGIIDESSSTFALEYKLSTDDDESWTVASSSITDTFYTITGLESLTDYDFRVYSICSSGNSSYSTGSFRTAPSDDNMLTFPYEQNFDDIENITNWTFVQNTSGARWFFGTAENNTRDENDELTQGGALYISSDNGQTASYNISTTTYAYAYAYLNLEEGSRYTVDFDWKDVGESCCDYFKVYLVGADYELSASSLLNTGAVSGVLNNQSTWQHESILLPNYSGAYKLVFGWKNDGSIGNNPPAVIDNLYITALACNPIDSLNVEWTVDESEAISATVNVYREGEDDASYILEYKTLASEEWIVVEGESPFDLSDMFGATGYQFRVTPVCGSDTSLTSNTLLSYSPCVTAPLPLEEGFEAAFFIADAAISNSAAPTCWNNINGGYSSYYFYRTTTASYLHNGTGALYFSGTSTSPTSNVFSDWMISPKVELTGNEQISFYIKSPSSYSTNKPVIDIYMCNVAEQDIASGADTSRFVHVATLTHPTLGTDYEVDLANLVPSDEEAEFDYGVCRVALAVRAPSHTFVIDDLKIDAIPDCPEVYNFAVSMSGVDGAAVTYNTENITDSGVEVVYAAASEGEFDPESATNSVIIPQDAELPYIITGLELGETYYFAARQACGGVFCATQTLEMPAFVIELPYSENFDDSEAEHGFTFTGTGSNTWFVGTATNNTIDEAGNPTTGGALYISNDNGTTAGYNISSSSQVYATSAPIAFGEGSSFTLSFDYKAGGEGTTIDYMKAYLVPIGATVSAQYEITDYINRTNGSWITFSTILPADYANSVYNLVFYWRNDGSIGTQPGACIDNIAISVMNCGAVESVSAVLVEPEVGSEDAPALSVSITDGNEEGSGITYTLRYKRAADESYTVVGDLTSSDFPYSIEGAEYQTTYTIEVASVCADGEPTPYATITITTPCQSNPAPWYESFDVSPFTTPTCWERKSGALPETGTIQTSSLTTTSSGFNYSTYTINGETSGMLRVNIWSTYKYWVITPPINLGDGTTTYKFSCKALLADNANGTGAPAAAPDDKFAVLVSTDNGVSWSTANAVIYADGDADTEHNYSDFTDSWTNIIYKLVDENDDPITGVVRLALYGGSTTSNADNYMFIDDMSVTEWSDCLEPFGVSVSNITHESADATFTEYGDATAWEYVLVEGENADPDDGTPVSISEADLPLQLTSLSPATFYTFALRSVCESGNSPWSEAVTFKTLATPEPVPYFTDFETEDDNNTWFFTGRTGNVNTWAIGSATFAGDDESGNSAYISNDGGESYAATVSTTSTYQYIWKDFDFGEDETAVYNLSFDWKAIGRVSGTSVYCGILAYIQEVTDPIPTTTFPTIERLALEYGSDTWQSDTVELRGLTGTKRLMFLTWGYTNASEIVTPAAIDNISIFVSPCTTAQEIEVSNITTNSADIAWEGTADSYIISYRKTSDSELTDVTVTSSPYTLTDLDDATEYIFAIRSVCGSETSIYSDAATFNTSCHEGAITTFPYTEGFENGLNCWTVTTSDVDYPWTVVSNGTSPSCAPHSGSSMAKYASYSTDEGEYSTMISPEFSFSQDMQLSFWMYRSTMYTSNNDRVLVYVNDEASEEGATLLTTVTQGGNDSWEEQVVTLPTGLTGSHYLIVKAISDYGANIYIDDITLSVVGGGEQPEPCDAPTALAVTNITQTSADFSWSGTASSYEVRLGSNAAETVTTTSTSFTDLTAGTTYTAYVRAVCEESNSVWVSTTFTTEAAPVVAPTVTTLAATGVTHNSATLNGTITLGNETITAQGFKYKTAAASTWTTVSASGTTLVATVNTLAAETAYEFKAFATTASGTVEGSVMTFTTTAAPVILPPTVTTLAATSVTHNSATLNGTIAAGDETITVQGFKYKTTAASTWTTVSASGTTITSTLNSLAAETEYQFKAFATTASGTVEGTVMTFTTTAAPIVAPTVATLAATSVTHNSATLNGTITAGSETITAQGFMYKATAAADWTNVSATGTTLAATVNGLTPETEYQFKAFATTASGTVEGTVMTFTTTAAPIVAPSVATLPATGVTHQEATLNGTVTTGSEAITAQGFMYKATAAADWTTVAATGETMSATINGLTAETAYQYKAFATTASGTVEGAVVNFTTLQNPGAQPTVVTLDATEITNESATLNGTVVAGTNQITAQGFKYKTVFDADWTTVEVAGTNISATISNLTAETQYEYKAFATTESGTVEGNVILFTTTASSGLNSAEGTVATMTVYPNPASERAIVAVSGVENGAKIVVSDMQGRIILSDNMTSETYELSVANMTSGVYYIRVIGTTSTHTQKLIV